MEVQEGLTGKHVATERELWWTCRVSHSRGGGGGVHDHVKDLEERWNLHSLGVGTTDSTTKTT